MALNIGLIGVGRIGKLHAEHLAHRVPGAKLRVIADVNEKAAREIADKCGVAEAVGDYREVLARKDIEAVVICTPTDTHAQLIEEASAAGKQIFCEKPIDIRIERVDAALAAVGKAGVKLQMGFNRRFDANFARVREAIRSGEIGEPQLLHIISRDPAPPPISYVKVSGGMFLDMTIHDFDMGRFLIGSEVTEIYAAAGVLVDKAIGDAGDVDSAHITLKFANGVIGTIDNCRQAVYGYDQRVEVLGTKGAARTENNFPNAAVISDGKTVWRDLPLNFFMERYSESFLTEMKMFVACVCEDKPLPVTGEDAREAVLMALAARKSYDLNRPVKVSELVKISKQTL
jgi:myo-inositol 2-dehydrogenase / D-chiro-inositol 1-dehydrogenase